MDMLEHFAGLAALDLVALALVFVAWFALGWDIEHATSRRPSVSKLVSERRRDWMKELVTRSPRIFDSQILASLREGTSFFASTAILAIGGVLALIGNTSALRGVAAEVQISDAPAVIWQAKLSLVAFFLIVAFLKFVWAQRLFGYCSVLMAAVPNDITDPKAYPMAAQAAELNISAAINYNRGLRGMYFALAVLGWLVGPVGLMLATVIVSWVIWSREFASQSRRVLMGRID